MPDAPAPIRQQLITDAVFTQLDTLTGVAVYRSEVPASPPLADGGGGRVGPYVVLWPFGGTPTRDQDLGDQTADVDYGMQVDCVAGFEADLEFLVDRVHALLYRWSPTIMGLAFGGLRPPVGYVPGAVQKNDAVNPPRFWLPLQFRTSVSR